MNIPKNTAALINAMNVFEAESDKVRQEINEAMRKLTKLRILNEEAQKLREVVLQKINELDPENKRCVIREICITDEPHGQEQFNGEWCLQHNGVEDGTYIGTYFYPIQESPYFVAMNYECKAENDE